MGSPTAAGKRVGEEGNHSWNMVPSKHHFKKPEIESTGLLFFFLFKPKLLRMLSGLARKTSLPHVSVLE